MNPFAGSAGDWAEACRYLGMLISEIERSRMNPGLVQMASATDLSLPDDSADAFLTDPPYYDAVPYADLSDYFYVWHKRALRGFNQEQFEPILCPKAEEAIVDPASPNGSGQPKDAAFYEAAIRAAMRQGVRTLRPNGIGVIVFAHKSTSGWEALLRGVVDAGWVVTASWPVDTERPGRLRAQESAALASSIHLVCRPRESPDGSLRSDDIGEWRDILQELPPRIHEWLPRLASEGVVGADAIFACLGPALEIFSRYSRVEKSDGSVVPLREYLEQVWAAVAKEALSLVFRDADASGLEPDARLTAMWLWTLKTSPNGTGSGQATQETENEDAGDEEEDDSTAKPQKGGFSLEFDAARKIAQGLGAHLESLTTVVEVKGQTARLIPVAERMRFLSQRARITTAAPSSTGDASAPAKSSKKGKKSRKPAKGQKNFGESEDGAFTTQPGAATLEPATVDARGAELDFTLGATVLDRVHQAMLLFGLGRAEALKRFVVEEGAGSDPRFWKLAQSLSALYPPGTDEKRWVDGVLARKKGLGL